MASLGQSIKSFGSNLIDTIRTILSAIGSFISSFFDVWNVSIDDVQGIIDDVKAIKSNVELEISKLKSFQFDAKFKTRVITVPVAIDQLRDLTELIVHDTTDKLSSVVDPLRELVLVWKQSSGDVGDPNNPNGLAKAATFLREVETTLKLVRQALDSVKDVSALFVTITDRIKNFDDLFLQQGNSRMRLTEKSTIRLGALHADVG